MLLEYRLEPLSGGRSVCRSSTRPLPMRRKRQDGMSCDGSGHAAGDCGQRRSRADWQERFWASSGSGCRVSRSNSCSSDPVLSQGLLDDLRPGWAPCRTSVEPSSSPSRTARRTLYIISTSSRASALNRPTRRIKDCSGCSDPGTSTSIPEARSSDHLGLGHRRAARHVPRLAPGAFVGAPQCSAAGRRRRCRSRNGAGPRGPSGSLPCLLAALGITLSPKLV